VTDEVHSSIINLVNQSNEILQFINVKVIKDYDTMVNVGKKYANEGPGVFQCG
jgi:methyl-accepting chemotaxis protein